MLRHVELRLNERAVPAEADRAMALVRDPARLAAYVSRLAGERNLRADWERLALPLSSSDQAAHLVVARDGAAVTCLAAGMDTGLPALNFDDVTAYLRAQEDFLRANMLAQREDLTSLTSPARRAFEHPHRLTRREFDQLRTLLPLLRDPLIEVVLNVSEALLRLRSRPGERLALPRDEAEKVWRAYCLAQLALMVGAQEPRMLSAAMLAAMVGDVQLSMRAWWVLANQPHGLLAEFEAVHQRSALPPPHFQLAWCAGSRFPDLRGEITRITAPIRPMWFDAEDVQRMVRRRASSLLYRFVGSTERDVLPQFDALRTMHTPAPLQPRAPSAIPKSERIRNRMWRFMFREVAGSAVEQGPEFCILATCAPIESLIPPDFPDAGLSLSRGVRFVEDELPRLVGTPVRAAEPVQPMRNLVPVRREEQPRPNDPCHCGSGKKFKKCHGAPT